MTPSEQLSEVIASLRVLQRTMVTGSPLALHRVDVIAHIGAPRVEMLAVLAHDEEHAKRMAALYVPEGIRHRARILYIEPMRAGLVVLGFQGLNRSSEAQKCGWVSARTAASILEDVS
jgi:hypothetical protein